MFYYYNRESLYRTHVNYNSDQKKWEISPPDKKEGDDVFIVKKDESEQIYTFSEGEYGKRVLALNIYNDGEGSYNLGVYHVSATNGDATGFYITPGGSPSNKVGSNKRIQDGCYPISTPCTYNKWRTPGVGGSVANRGIRFHYGYSDPLKWTKGCFVLSSNYSLINGNIKYDSTESKESSINFNKALGASSIINYDSGKNKIRTGAIFQKPIEFLFQLKSM